MKRKSLLRRTLEFCRTFLVLLAVVIVGSIFIRSCVRKVESEECIIPNWPSYLDDKGHTHSGQVLDLPAKWFEVGMVGTREKSGQPCTKRRLVSRGAYDRWKAENYD